jgi:hypothetical protein
MIILLLQRTAPFYSVMEFSTCHSQTRHSEAQACGVCIITEG